MEYNPVIGLVRHQFTEAPGSSVGETFLDIQDAVSQKFQVELFPAYYHSLSPLKKSEVGTTFLQQCSLVIIGGQVALDLFSFRSQVNSHVPILYLTLGGLPRGARSLRRIFPYFRSTDTIAFTSLSDQQIFKNLMATCTAQQLILPFGVDEELFRRYDESERLQYRELFEFGENDIVFTYIGRVTAEKNVHTIIRIFKDLIEKYDNLYLLIVGPVVDIPFEEFMLEHQDLWSFLKNIVANSPLSARVKWIGPLSKDLLPIFYNTTDIFINLTLHHDENFGHTQIEAMSCGIPVIGTDWGGLKDTICHNETGFKVPTFLTNWGITIDRYSAFKYCKALIESKELRNQMSKRARDRIVRNYSLSIFQNQLYSEMQRMLAQSTCSTAYNQLSNFGLKYHFTFSKANRDEYGRLLSINPENPVYSQENYDLYSSLIHPYTSERVNTNIRHSDILFFAPQSFQIEGNIIHITEILWPRVYKADVLDIEIIQYLIANSYVQYQQVITDLCTVACESKLRSRIVKLLMEGIIVKSIK